MPTFFARVYNSPRFVEAHFQALKQDGQLPDDVAPHAEAHLQYVKDMAAQGKYLSAGPIVAFTWGINLVRADSLEEAKKIIDSDPGWKGNIFTHYEIEPWYRIV